MGKKIDSVTVLCTIVSTMWPDLGRATNWVLKSEPYTGVLARSTDGMVLEILTGEYEEVFPAELRKIWGQLSSSTRDSFFQVGLTCQALAKRGITLAAAWRLMEDQIDFLTEEGAENLRNAVTVSALSRFDPRIDLDQDFLDPDALVSETIMDAKAIFKGEYHLPLHTKTLENTYELFKQLVCPDENDEVKSPRGKTLAELLFNLVSAIASEEEPQRAQAIHNFLCYVLARRVARDHGHDTKEFRNTGRMEMEPSPESTSERLIADAEFEADLDHLISQAQLSSGEEVVLRGLVDGLEGHGLEYYAKPHGISPNSVRQMKKRALNKVGKVIE